MKNIQQVLFWLFSGIALVLIFGKPYGGYINSFYFVTFLLPVIIGTSYLFNSFLVPKYLLQKQYFKFGLYTFYTVVVSLNLEMLIIFLAFAVLANYQFEQMVPAATNIIWLALAMYFIVMVKAFILLIKSSFVSQEEINTLEEKQSNMQKGYLIVRADRKNVKILLEDILFIESLSDYVKINLRDRPVVITKEKISSIEEKLTKPFLRIHRSFIINADKIDKFSAEHVSIASNELPISRTYKKTVQLSLSVKKT